MTLKFEELKRYLEEEFGAAVQLKDIRYERTDQYLEAR